MKFTPRERIKMRGFCTGPVDGAPGGLGAVGADYRATCCTCGRRVRVTVRGLYAHHKPKAKGSDAEANWEARSKLLHPDGDAIEVDVIDAEFIILTVKQGPHEICRLAFTGEELDVLIDRLQRARSKVTP